MQDGNIKKGEKSPEKGEYRKKTHSKMDGTDSHFQICFGVGIVCLFERTGPCSLCFCFIVRTPLRNSGEKPG
jgi:hypothetical protein